MKSEIEIVCVHEQDDRWIAQIDSLDVRTSGATDCEAVALALRAIADKIESNQLTPAMLCIAVTLGGKRPLLD
jgi:hypothetical protein